MPRQAHAGPAVYGFDGDRFFLQPDTEGDLWDPNWPVFGMGWNGARAYTRWRAAHTGRPWRLPLALEWEKAGRGVDGRLHPWGDFIDECWYLGSRSTNRAEDRHLLAVVDSHPVDRSVYGVRGLAGNMEDWCLDLRLGVGPRPEQAVEPADDPGELGDEVLRTLRGGHWLSTQRGCRLSSHRHSATISRTNSYSFRTVFEPPTDG